MGGELDRALLTATIGRLHDDGVLLRSRARGTRERAKRTAALCQQSRRRSWALRGGGQVIPFPMARTQAQRFPVEGD